MSGALSYLHFCMNAMDQWKWVNIFTANNQTTVLFLMGNDPNMNEDDKMWLIEEEKNYNDVIEVNGLIEHYNNLTLKTLYTIKFFIAQGQFY